MLSLCALMAVIPIQRRHYSFVDASLPSMVDRRLDNDEDSEGKGESSMTHTPVTFCLDENGDLVSREGDSYIASDGSVVDGGGRDLGEGEGDGDRDDDRMWEKCKDHSDVPSSGGLESDDAITNSTDGGVVSNGTDASDDLFSAEHDDDSILNGTEAGGVSNGTEVGVVSNSTEAPKEPSVSGTLQPQTSRPTSRNPSLKPLTRSPTRTPTHASPVADSRERPTLPPSRVPMSLPPIDWSVLDKWHLVSCRVSCALPPLLRKPSDDSSHDSHDNAAYASQDEELVEHSPAYRFLHHVREVMAQTIYEATNFTIVLGRRDDEDDAHNSFSSDSEIQEPHDFHGGDVVLDEALPKCNTTEKERLVGEHEGVVWWMYTILYYTNGTNYTHVQDLVTASVVDAVESGAFFEDLLEVFPRLVAVSLPGEESSALLGSGSSASDDDASREAYGVDVQVWDPSRWIGLGLFLFTLFASLAFTRTAIHRRKKLQEYEEWGIGLASETDMNQFLTLGCEFDGDQVRTYDKSNFVYRDDDSMLSGGVLPLHYEIGDKAEVIASTVPPTSAPTDASPSSGIGTQPSDLRGNSSSGSL